MTKKRFTEDSYRKEPWFRALCTAVLSCKTEEEVADFLRDVATLSELQALSERLEVAKQITQGLSYREVAKQTGASTTTVTRVAKFIENGCGGYRRFLHAHRHHRMVQGKGTTMNIENKNTNSSQEENKKPEQISVLQKYLNRH
jgi:TrpR-related protein YerC/YecD